MLDIGYIHIYTGDGKGKTSAALGLAFRALGRGLKVYITQFMKAEKSSGEHFAAKAFDKQLVIKPMGLPGFILPGKSRPEDRQMARKALAEAKTAMKSHEYDVIILDEINVAVSFSLLEVKDVMDFLAIKPPHVELILTGRNAHPDIIEKADLVSDVKQVKHYLQEGIKARKGVEF
ncbi:MAG: cob(I)yrinic acid a,c-diamide adenosyltransferase [Deltaproteobacteria bacterium]|nr:cob(I)yrinic acid a,c-diamide adenosyltransferase [Deltaproteobacteria bacterium]